MESHCRPNPNPENLNVSNAILGQDSESLFFCQTIKCYVAFSKQKVPLLQFVCINLPRKTLVHCQKESVRDQELRHFDFSASLLFNNLFCACSRLTFLVIFLYLFCHTSRMRVTILELTMLLLSEVMIIYIRKFGNDITYASA